MSTALALLPTSPTTHHPPAPPKAAARSTHSGSAADPSGILRFPPRVARSEVLLTLCADASRQVALDHSREAERAQDREAALRRERQRQREHVSAGYD